MVFLIKMLGVCLIIISTTIIGTNRSHQLSFRVESLEWYTKTLRQIADRIRYSGDEITKILLSLPENQKYFSITAPFKVQLIKNGLNSDDMAAVHSFFDSIGLGDTENQLNMCSLYGKELSSRLDEARKDLTEKSRLFKSLGFFIGLAVAIILV